jgi:elongator complex protein 4
MSHPHHTPDALTAYPPANPSLMETFPTHHGFVHVHALPAPHTLVPPSDRYSVLRGLSSSAVAAGGSGENNLAFRCTRKRLVVETLHLDLEGGVGERRTTPSVNAIVLETGLSHAAAAATGPTPAPVADQASGSMKGAPLVQIALEGGAEVMSSSVGVDGPMPVEQGQDLTTDVKTRKEKKKVTFRPNGPELYDF